MENKEIMEMVENMNANEFVQTVCSLPAEMQNEFLASLKDVMTEEEYKAIASYISLYSMFHNPAKYNAMKEACKEALVEKFYGHPCEKGCSAQEGVYSYHPQSICSVPILLG